MNTARKLPGGSRAYCGFSRGWAARLYVDPTHHGEGIGSALLGKALEGQSSVRLWVFQRNRPAIEFYRRHRFELVEETNGAGNEEREPDALYEWVASQQR
jgi:ribosomal protein S18 acetylase RimI-like enzyme